MSTVAFKDENVALVRDELIVIYPTSAPFQPHDVFPEIVRRVERGKDPNPVYPLVRELFAELHLDLHNFSTAAWNPLGEIINPGQKVLVKPNLVRHIHIRGGDYNAVVTHGSIIRCVLDYVALALQGKGEIVVGDAPIQSADFDKTVERTGLRAVCNDIEETWKIPVKLVDFRLTSVKFDEKHRIVENENLKGDPAGYRAVNLGNKSLLTPLNTYFKKFRVTNYGSNEMRKHHNHQRHEYLIPKTVLESDVVINLPKLKTHRKVGMTASLKNLVGINGHKDWLPHHRYGSIQEGGDEYKYSSFLKRFASYLGEKIDYNPYSKLNYVYRNAIRIARRLNRILARDPYEEGSWYGNDTLWRTVLDLNRLLIYADRNGKMDDFPQRKVMTIVDAIIAGEGEGPMEPDAKACSVIVGGINPVAIDAVLATMIGFDYKILPIVSKGFKLNDWPLINIEPEDIQIFSEDSRIKSIKIGKPFREFCLKPPSGWFGHVETEGCMGNNGNRL